MTEDARPRVRRFLVAVALVAGVLVPSTAAAMAADAVPAGATMVSSFWDVPGPISPCGGCWPKTA